MVSGESIISLTTEVLSSNFSWFSCGANGFSASLSVKQNPCPMNKVMCYQTSESL